LTENAGHEILQDMKVHDMTYKAWQISYENRLRYIRVYISFKSLVCKTSMLTYKKS